MRYPVNEELTIEQRLVLQRARYEMKRMSRPALEKTALRILKSRMEMKNGIQCTLRSSGMLFRIEEPQQGMPDIISEETFIELLKLYDQDEVPTDINDVGWEDEDIESEVEEIW